jgi:hypothetical protein
MPVWPSAYVSWERSRASSPELLRDWLAADIAKWTAVIDEAGIERI